jgi:dephospho-CoA kinase
MNSPLFIGITGGIGSGKTTVCKAFENLGIPVYYSDNRAKYLIQNDIDIQKNIILTFGNESYLPDGAYNPKHISSIVFKNNSKLHELNEIVHPAVIADAKIWHLQQNVPYCLKESALIFEQNLQYSVNKIITIVSNLPLRIERIMKRDNMSQELVLQRINKQLSDEYKIPFSDFLVYNCVNSDIEKQVIFLHHFILKKYIESQ